MRFLAPLIAAAMIAPGCFTAEPESAEYYRLTLDSQLSNLALNSRPNMDATVKQIVGIAEDGTTYVVDLCLGVSTGTAVNASAEDVMVCVGVAQDPRGFNIQQHSCFDGRSSSPSAASAISVDLVNIGQGIDVLHGTVGVTIPAIDGSAGTVDVDSDFQVRVNTGRSPRSVQDDSVVTPNISTSFPWGAD